MERQSGHFDFSNIVDNELNITLYCQTRCLRKLSVVFFVIEHQIIDWLEAAE